MTLQTLKIYKTIALRYMKGVLFNSSRTKHGESLVVDNYSKSWSQGPGVVIIGKKLRWYEINVGQLIVGQETFGSFWFRKYIT